MTPLQTLRDSNGIEVVLFPLEYMNISQDENGSYSHQNTYNIDFLGWSSSGRLVHCPFYAPVTLKCVNDSWDTSTNVRVYESTDRVHFADGSIDYLTIMFAHDEYPIYNVGSIIPQGTLLGHTGEQGLSTGDHVHSCCGKGTYQGFTQRTGGHWDLTNRCHYWDATFINDTTIIEGCGHNWLEYNGQVTSNVKTKFPWVLYARKLRNKNS